MRLAPRGGAGVAEVVPEQKRLQALLALGDLPLALLPGPHHVAKRLLLRTRDVHRGQRAGAQPQDEVAGIAPIGLDAVTGATRDQRGRGDQAALALASQVPMQPEAARPGFVDELQRTVASQLGEHPIDRILLGADGGDIDHRVAARRPDPTRATAIESLCTSRPMKTVLSLSMLTSAAETSC